MHVALKGSSPGATTAGILLMTRARQLGLRLQVVIEGDPDDITPVPGPAVVYAPVLASCGVGRKDGIGGTCVVSGPPGAPLLVSVAEHGLGGWFIIDRGDAGSHPATQAYARLATDARVPARHVAKELRRAMETLGMAPEPAVLDVLFGAPSPPLTRLAFALRAGRALSGHRGQPITRFLSTTGHNASDPLPSDADQSEVLRLLQEDALDWILDGLTLPVRDRVEDWLDQQRTLLAEDDGRDLELLVALAEAASHLVQLPAHSILPPLDAAMDAVAFGLRAGLTASGDGNASFQLGQVYRFLGGTYTERAEHAHQVDHRPAPEGADREALWRWFCEAALEGQRRADELWPEITDPAS